MKFSEPSTTFKNKLRDLTTARDGGKKYPSFVSRKTPLTIQCSGGSIYFTTFYKPATSAYRYVPVKGNLSTHLDVKVCQGQGQTLVFGCFEGYTKAQEGRQDSTP